MANREYDSRETNQGRNEGSTSSFLLGAIIGGAVGAAAALFLTPKTGKDLRNTIGSNAGSIVNKTGQLSETVKTKGTALAAKTSTLSQGIVQQSAELLSKVKEKAISKEEAKDDTEINYISIGSSSNTSPVKQEDKGTANDDEIRKKLLEAQMAFDEEENRIKL
ncbi:YtxH domain-containing protein [Neobacillus kokaensis]|uniref:YtxH domain-containing protein n=1 Tax=Neobacillus kokaensis TaxID=2759023 RepID=A0ABQ3MXB3_9BACI|nr:YtxH domain-containing protein [Neobacillus kokaensis]GHH97325.1 hypothetical protein AM1BK_08680 [Neobacillus kokaensis]